MARYWVGGTGDWAGTTHWATTSGGASGASEPDSTQDVYFDTNSGLSGNTVTVTVAGGICKSLTASTGVSWTLASSGGGIDAYGSVTLEATTTVSGASFSITLYGAGAKSIDTKGIDLIAFEAYASGAVTLLSDLEASNGMYIEDTNFDADIYNVTFGYGTFATSSVASITVDMGTGTWTVTNNYFSIDDGFGSGMTLSGGSSTLNYGGVGTDVGYLGAQYSAPTLTFGVINITKVGRDTFGLYFGGDMTIGTLNADTAVDLHFEQSKTITVTNWNVNGTALEKIGIDSHNGNKLDGGVNSWSMTSGGTGYTANDRISATGGDGHWVIQVYTVNGSGTVTSSGVSYYGAGYSVAGTVNFTGGTGSGFTASIASIYSATEHYLSRSSSYSSSTYLDIKDSNASGGTGWYAGTNSTDSGGNTGWTFTAPPGAKNKTSMLGVL